MDPALSFETLLDTLPDWARDLKLNTRSLTESGSLTPAQRWGTAVASAASAGSPALLAAVALQARGAGLEAAVEDGLAAAALMGMNNVYYRFRTLVGKETYSQKPAGLRMTRIAKPAGPKADFELFCLAVSAINGCGSCVKSHEATVLEQGLTEDNVHDAVRLASAIHGAATALKTVSALS